MQKFSQKIKKYTQYIYWAFVFVITVSLLFLILPGEPKFKYEYQKGLPWRHENLVAPFDFAILKSDAELDEEKQLHLQSVIPYFSYDTSVVFSKLSLLENELAALQNSPNEKTGAVFTAIKEKLVAIYESGILQGSVDSNEQLQNKNEIRKRTGTRILKIETNKLYSEKTAYNELHAFVNTLVEKIPETAEFLESLALEKFLTANLFFDDETTQKEIDLVLKNISSTRGMVQTGERIILEGEIVDSDKFQVLESLKASYEKERGEGINRYMVSAGKAGLIIILLAFIAAFLYIYRRDVLNQFSKLSFLMLFLIGIVFITNFVNTFPSLNIYIVPFAIFPIVIRTFFDSRTAIFMLIITTILVGFYAPNNYEFVLLQVSAGIVAVFSLNKMHLRVHLVLATLWVLLTYVLVFAALNLVHEGTLLSFNYKMLQWFGISCGLLLAVYPLVYIFEKIFGFVSDVTLIELSDSNQPLLRKLAEEAPGTFQHSMQIANLAEEIILKIGGNPFLVRAGALYHDIGKIAKPNFFIENQAVGMNPHDEMSYLKSAEIIIDHVKNGVKMAQKHKLPEPIVEFIATHNGTTKANYFS